MDKQASLVVDMEKVLGRFVRKAADNCTYANMSIKDMVRLVEMYDEAYVNIIIEHYQRMDQIEEDAMMKARVQLQRMDEDDEDDEPKPDPDAPNVLDWPENQSGRD